MGNFNNNRSDRGRGGDNRGFQRPQMNQAICSKCGKSCLVPFKPTGNRPIFCSDCFRTEGGVSSRRTDERNPQTALDRSDRPMYDAICDECGNRCQIPFQPRPGKQVFCSHCFEQKGKENSGTQDRPRTSEQFDALNAKLDKILQLLSPTIAAVTVPEKVARQKRGFAPEEKATQEIEVQRVTKTEEKDTSAGSVQVKKAPTTKKAAPKKKASAKTK